MMSYEYIREQGRKAAARARREQFEPLSFGGLGEDAIRDRLRYLPHLGNYRVPGWKRVNVAKEFFNGDRYTHGLNSGAHAGKYLFVDSSGFGARDEPAMQYGEFGDFVIKHPEYGYAIIEAGQFQVVIAVYKRVPS